MSKEDIRTISEIADRAGRMAARQGFEYSKIDAMMDLEACHSNGNPLRLVDLQLADDTNFAHDVFGIRRHLNRETLKLENCFSPRYSA